MKINSIIDLVKDLDTSRQTKNLNKLLIRILLHLQVEFSGFNSNSQGLKLEESSNAPKYLIKISATNFFQRKGWGPYGRMVLKIWGNIEVVEIKTSQTVYSAKLDGFIGHADFKTTDRFAKLFMELGKSFSNK